MKKLPIVVCLCALLSILFAGSSLAEEEWQDISAIGLHFRLPADWEEVEEEMGLSDQETIWFKGDFEEPTHFLILIRGEGVAEFMEFIVEEDDEDMVTITDETIDFLGYDARSVLILNQHEEDYGYFIVMENFVHEEEELFMMIICNDHLFPEFQPVLEEIIDSFALAN